MHAVRKVSIYSLAGAIVGLVYVALNDVYVPEALLRGALLGFIIAGGIGSFEAWIVGSPPHRWFVALPFLAGLLVRTLAYGMIATSALGVVALTASGSLEMTLAYLASSQFLADIAVSFAAAIVFNFINSMQELLGGRKFANLLAGRYHRPRLENRVFLFIDMKNTTMLAEHIGDMAFHAMLAEFCEDVGRAILRHGGEIDRFVGDQVVATWAVRDRNPVASIGCYRAIADAKAILLARAASYISRYGAPADLRAGLHCGPVVAGELGVGRREIGFVGDAVNTAARIEQSCRMTGEDIMASAELVHRIPPPRDVYGWFDLEPIALRGKAEPLAIVALRRVGEAVPLPPAQAGRSPTGTASRAET